jgi:serine/threonine protein phosphatase 1
MAGRLFAIGDIHGCAGELEALLAALPLAPGDTVACIGDYLDRGPDSREVIEQLVALRARPGLGTVFLKGNHEDMCLAWLGRPGRFGEAWFLNGGLATLRSYGLDARTSGAEAATILPPAHVDFLERLVLTHVAGDYRLVHAGIRPERTWDDQDEEDLLWVREEFIAHPHAVGATIVFGHTPHREVLVDLPYKIGIDTGCVYGGWLSALELPGLVVRQVRKGERQVRTAPLRGRR